MDLLLILTKIRLYADLRSRLAVTGGVQSPQENNLATGRCVPNGSGEKQMRLRGGAAGWMDDWCSTGADEEMMIV